MRGQALVEFALALPIILFTVLGSIEAGFVLIQKAAQDRETYLVAQWAATHDNDSWQAIASRELPGCSVVVVTPIPNLTEATTTCPYRPRTGLPLFDRLTIRSQEAGTGSPVGTSAALPS